MLKDEIIVDLTQVYYPAEVTCVKSGDHLQVAIPKNVKEGLKLNRGEIVKVLFQKTGKIKGDIKSTGRKNLRMNKPKDPFFGNFERKAENEADKDGLEQQDILHQELQIQQDSLSNLQEVSLNSTEPDTNTEKSAQTAQDNEVNQNTEVVDTPEGMSAEEPPP